jgi:broad specificity phosphatase PhoE
MPVTRLYLIRHGQSAGNAAGRFGGHSPTPLSELGARQAEITAQALAKERITVIYSSDLFRAVQTAIARRTRKMYLPSVTLQIR